MMNETSKKQSPVEALRRGLALLDYLSSRPEGMMLSELSSALSLHRTTVHNLLKTLVYSGYAENDGTGRYRVGWHLHELLRLQRLQHHASLDALMGVLTEEHGETLVLAHLVDGCRKALYHTNCNQAIQVNANYMEQNAHSIWNLETGIILAAYARAEELARVVSRNGIPQCSWFSGGSLEALAEALAEVHAAGFISLEHKGIYAAAVPVLDENGRLLAALGINQPLFRHKPENESALIEKLQDDSRRIAAVMDLQ